MLLVGPQVPLLTFSYALAGLLSKDKTWQIKFKYATSCSGMHNVIELRLFVVNFCLPVLSCIVTCFVCLFGYVLYLVCYWDNFLRYAVSILLQKTYGKLAILHLTDKNGTVLSLDIRKCE